MERKKDKTADAGSVCRQCKGYGYMVMAPSTCSAGGERITCRLCQPSAILVVAGSAPNFAALSDRATDQSDEMQFALSLCYAILAPGQDANAILRANPEARLAAHRAIYERRPHDEPYDAMMARLAALNDRATDREGEPSAYLKEWGPVHSARKRVDLAPDCEPWLVIENPTITPLYPARQPIADLTGEIEALAQFLHDEGNFSDAMADRSWPEHPGDTGQREGGWVKIVPSDVQAHFRDVARRWLSVPSPRVATLTARLAQAEEALRPFADLARRFDEASTRIVGVGIDGQSGTTVLPVGGKAIRATCGITISDLAAARAALAGPQPGGKGGAE